MPVEIVGMVGTRDASEIKGPLVDGPVVDWTDGPVVDPAYLDAISRAHDDGGFDRVLIGYGAVGPEGWMVAASVLQSTTSLKVLVAHRPGLVPPLILARQATTLDHLSGGGRVAIHMITGGDEADQRREGDHIGHDDRYRRTAEVMEVVRRVWAEDVPFDSPGEFHRCEGAFSSVKPVQPGGIPMWFAGASPSAVHVGARLADVYAFWGEPRAAVAERIAAVRAATPPDRTAPGFSLSVRPIIADTEDEAWSRAEWIAAETADRIERARRRKAPGADTGLGGDRHATFAVERDLSVTTSHGRRRLIELSERADVLDERLWMKVALLTGAAGNSTALVGTPAQVADAMLRYYDLGVDHFLLRGFDPLVDAVDFGRRLLPLVRQGVAERDRVAGAPATSPDRIAGAPVGGAGSRS